MKVLLVMESWDMSTGPYESLYPYYRDILISLGHEVQVVDNKTNYLPVGGQTMWDYPPSLKRLRWEKWNNYIVDRYLKRAVREFSPHLVLLNKCENVSSSTIEWIKAASDAVIINWNHDNPFWPGNTSIDMLRSVRLVDAYCVFAKHFFPALVSIGCSRVEYLPMFFNRSRLQLPPQISEDDRTRLSSEICFIGLGTPERAEMLRHLVDFGLAIWGEWSWLPVDDPLRSCVRGRYLDGREYAMALHLTKIAVNVMNMQCRMASNTRTFEATGMGALLLTEYSREQAEDLFVEDEDILCFRTAEELRDKARYYLSHEAERQGIAKAGMVRTHNEHTLLHRLQRILEIAAELRATGANWS